MGYKTKSSGFTLIEALIAFLLLTIGLLGASLFHSTLLRENSDNKSRLEAVEILETQIEKARVAAAELSTATNLLTTVQNAVSTSITTNLNVYDISVSTAAASLDDLVTLTLSIDWDGNGSDPISVVSYLSWSREDFENESGIDLGAATAGYEGDIPIPTGTLTAVPRVELKTQILDPEAEGTKLRDVGNDLVVYMDGEDAKVAVKLDDNTYVQLATLSEDTNEIISISGRIYGYPFENSKFVSDEFGTVYGIEKPEDSSCQSGWILIDGYCFEDEIIDLRATAGANCIITDWRNQTSNPKGGLWADYLCVAGTGWNGGIKPYFREFDQGTAKNLEIGTSNGGKGLVCSPSLRNYRYYIIEVSEDNFDSLATDGSVNPTTAIASAAATIAGQSGLVRFTDDSTDIDTWPERVLWADYFWHNPDYIVNPTAIPELSTSAAKYGYKVPGVVSGADFMVNYPGDVARQNFVIADFGTGKDCTDILAGFKAQIDAGNLDVFGTEHIVDLNNDNRPDYLDHAYLYEKGFGGYEGTYAYKPSVGYDVDDYNDYSGVYKNGGSIILGYALKTSEISGLIYIPEGTSIADYVLVGDPNPLDSLVCAIDSSPTAGAPSGYSSFGYTCGIPTNWSGNIFVYPKASILDAPAEGVAINFPSITACGGENDLLNAKSDTIDYSWSTSDETSFVAGENWTPNKIELALYSFYTASSGLSSTAPGSGQAFSRLFIHNFETAVSSSQRSVNFGFTESDGSCPIN